MPLPEIEPTPRILGRIQVMAPEDMLAEVAFWTRILPESQRTNARNTAEMILKYADTRYLVPIRMAPDVHARVRRCHWLEVSEWRQL